MINMNYVQLSLDEYDRLKEVQVEATTLVEQTNTNLKQKLDAANSKIAELEAENRKYAIGGVRIKEGIDTMPTISGKRIPPKPLIEMIPVEDVTEESPIDMQDALDKYLTSTDLTGGLAKMGRRRWTDYEVAFMKTHASVKASLSFVAQSLNRTVSSIKTQASRMGLFSSNGILSLEK